jgi:hypothetical protein
MGGGKFLSNLFSNHKFYKIENYFIFTGMEKKCEPIDKGLHYFLPKKLSLSSQNYGLGIQIRKKPITDPGGQKSARSRIGYATLTNRIKTSTLHFVSPL